LAGGKKYKTGGGEKGDRIFLGVEIFFVGGNGENKSFVESSLLGHWGKAVA